MNDKYSVFRASVSAAMIAVMLAMAIPAGAQDLVPVSDITGGSSVFVFKNSGKATKKFTTTGRVTRTKAQRLDTAKKIKKQYETLAKAEPRRTRSAVVDPEKLPPSVRTMPKEQASKLFAGVGEYYIDRNDLENSISFFRESTVLDAKNISARHGLSDALSAKGNDLLVNDKATVARAYFQEALKNNPKNAAAYFGLGEVFSELDQTDDAVANYEKALANDPALTEIYVPLGILYFQKGEIAKADDLLSKALANSSETSETQVFLGTIRMSQNRNPEALAAFQRAKTLDPANPEAWFNSGEVMVRLNRSKDAVGEYQKAVALRSNYFEAWQSLGSAFLEQSNYTEAINAYKQAAKLKNDNADVQLALGDAYRMAGNYNEAIGAYDLATLFMARSKDYSKDETADVYSKIGFAVGRQCEINQRNFIACQWPVAIKALEKAVEIGGGSPADFANLGWAYYNAARIDQIDKREAERMKKLELAKVNLQKAVASNPPFIEGPLLNLGMTLTDLGDYAGAVDALTRVIKKEPKWVFALNELGIAYRKQNNFKEAINYFNKAIDKDKKFASAYYNLGEAEFRNGNIGNTKKAYQALKAMGRNDLANGLDIMTNGAVRR